MSRWELSRLADYLLGLPIIWMILWLGLAALTIALLVLMRTNWGQSRPLRKCAVLSLMAHVMFACFATTIKIVSITGSEQSCPSIYVSLSAAPQSQQDNETINPVAPVQPWDVLRSESVEPDVVVKDRADLADEPEIQRPAATDSSELPSALADAAPGRNATDAQPDVESQISDVIAHNQPQALSEAIETPQAQRREARQVELPDDTPARSGLEGGTPVPLEREPVQQASADLVDQPILPPRAANLVQTNQAEDALDATVDLLSRAASPAPAELPDAKVIRNLSAAQQATAGQPAEAGQDLTPVSVVRRSATGQPSVSSTASLSETNGGQKEQRQLPSLYRQRTAPDRAKIVSKHGGGRETEVAVEAALAWLTAVQEEDGRWDASTHGAGTEQQVLGNDRKKAGLKADTGITALALLCYLGAGHTHQEGKYQETVRRGLVFLMSKQDTSGSLAGEATLYARMYCHGMATLALSEAFAMSGDSRLRDVVEKAIGYTVIAQNRSRGGWRYRPGDVGDTSQLGWQVMAVKSAELAGIHVPSNTRTQMIRFLASVSAGQHKGLACYQSNRPVSRTMTAEALFCRQLLGLNVTPEMAREASTYILDETPGQGRPNLYYWYYGTLAMYQLQGKSWESWNKALKTTLLRSQEMQGGTAGSWAPDTVWGGHGGRVYSTAMATLSLEVYYRYLPIFSETVRTAQPWQPVLR